MPTVQRHITDLPKRQIHLDFHTPAWAEDVAGDFDADRFADALAEARVTSVTCFARCHHGLMYYPTRMHPELVHPNLRVPDLLNRQIAACHERGIRTPVYTTVQWDQRQATDHPEWLCVGEDGGPIGGDGPLKPGFYQFLDVFHPGYRAFLRDHVADLLATVPGLDGLFFDIVQVRGSLAPHWLAAMDEAGVDPADPAARDDFARRIIDTWKLEMSDFCRSLPGWTPDKTLFYNAGHVGPLDAATAGATTHHEIESLPGGQWGYLHFPIAHAYARTSGKPSLAMTGRFHTTWGDFHSYRRPAALEYECLRAVCEGASAVSVGDQLDPSGRLDPNTYDLIGGVFRKLEAIEPHLEGARATREIAILTPEAVGGETNKAAAGALGAMGGEVGEADSGAVALLNDLHRQADRVTPDDDFSAYAAVVVPDRVHCDDALADKLQRYLDGGGAVLLSGECGRARRLAGVTAGDEHGRALDFLSPLGDFAPTLPRAPHVAYEAATPVGGVADDAEVLAESLPPLADRSYRHYFGHRHAPAAESAYQPAVVRRGRCVYFAHRVFELWHRYAMAWCRETVRAVLDDLAPPLVAIEGGPPGLDAKLVRRRDGALVLSLLYYPITRRTAGGPAHGMPLEVIEAAVPVRVGEVRLRLPVGRATVVPEDRPLKFETVGQHAVLRDLAVDGTLVIRLDTPDA